jgi:hypothetical protein
MVAIGSFSADVGRAYGGVMPKNILRAPDPCPSKNGVERPGLPVYVWVDFQLGGISSDGWFSELQQDAISFTSRQR